MADILGLDAIEVEYQILDDRRGDWAERHGLALVDEVRRLRDDNARLQAANDPTAFWRRQISDLEWEAERLRAMEARVRDAITPAYDWAADGMLPKVAGDFVVRTSVLVALNPQTGRER